MNPSDLLRLVLAIAIVPPILLTVRRYRGTAFRNGVLALVCALAISYVASTIEQLLGPEAPWNLVQHTAYAVAGVCAVYSALALRREVLDARGDSR